MQQYMLFKLTGQSGRCGQNRRRESVADFWKLILPLCKPVLATVGTFTFSVCGAFVLRPLIVTRSKEMRVIEVGIAMFSSQYVANIRSVSRSNAIVHSMILIYLFAQKWIVLY